MSLKYKILNVVQFDDSGEMKRREGGVGWCNLSLVLYKTVLLPNTYLVYENTGKSLNSIEILDVGLRLSFDRSSYCLLYGRTRRFYDRK